MGWPRRGEGVLFAPIVGGLTANLRLHLSTVLGTHPSQQTCLPATAIYDGPSNRRSPVETDFNRGNMNNSAKYQIFISSTFEDLQEERDQVIRAVLEMGHIPVGMEMFSAADEEQWKIIARHIEQSDYYAVISAHRLGSITPEGISYTQKEYEYAKGLGIPILGFLIDDKATWPADRVDKNTRMQNLLNEFKSIIRTRPVSFWSNAEDLYGKFSVALMKAITASPRPGWVRASDLNPSPEITAEVIRLSSENAFLRKQLTAAEDKSNKDHKNELQQVLETMFSTKRTYSYRYTPAGPWQNDQTTSLFDAFVKLGPEMMIEGTVESMARTLAMEIRVDKSQQWDLVALNQVRDLLADLMALDLVKPSSRKHPVADKNEYWSLAPTGLELLKISRRFTLPQSRENKPEDTEIIGSRDSNTQNTETTGESLVAD